MAERHNKVSHGIPATAEAEWAAERLQALIDAVAAVVAYVDSSGRYRLVNRSFERWFGLSRDRICGRPVRDVLGEAAWKTIAPHVARALAGEEVTFEQEVPFQMRGPRWVRATYSPDRDAAGRVRGFVAHILDVTEPKAAEARLQESESRLRSLFENSPVPTWEEDFSAVKARLDEVAPAANGNLRAYLASHREEVVRLAGLVRVVDVNLASVAFFDVGSKEEIWRHLPDYFYEDSLAVFADEVATLAEGATRYDAEIRIKTMRGDDKTLLLELSIGPGCENTWARVFVSFIDLTARKRAETALRDSHQRYRSLFENMLEGVAHCRMLFENGVPQDFVCLDVNEAFERLTGLENVVGRRVTEVIPGIRQSDPGLFEAYGRVALTGIPERFETYLESLGIWFSVSVYSPQAEHFVAVFDNVTERKRTEAALQQSQKLEALGTLAGGIAHDFNNILLAIIGNAKLAIADVPADHPARAALTEIDKATGRAADLVRRVLAFSRPQEETRSILELRPVVSEAVALLRASLPAMIDLRTEWAPGVPPVLVAPTQIHQVIVNLATNAADSIGAREGVIDIRCDALDVDAGLARVVPGLHEGRYARVQVRDTGCGIEWAVRERIFDPFFTTKPVGLNTGLGLSIVHGIMTSCGGAVTVDSEPGSGATFSLYFPAADGPVTKPAPSRETVGGRGERVLYVDDDEALVLLMTRILARLGYAITGYADAEEALQRFRACPQGVDVVVTDLGMPKMSGMDFARAVRAIRADVPIILTTGYVRPEDQVAARAIGVTDLIFKPNTADELGHVLAQLFAARREQ